MTQRNMIESADVSQGKKPLIHYKYASPPITPDFPHFLNKFDFRTQKSISEIFPLQIFSKKDGPKIFIDLPTEIDSCATFHVNGASICYPDSNTYREMPRQINPVCLGIVEGLIRISYEQM